MGSLRPSRWWWRIAALVVALVIVTAGIVGYLLFAPPPTPSHALGVPPHVIAILATGTTMLEVPLMTEYTALPLPNNTLDTNVSFRVSSTIGGPSTTFHMHWSSMSGASEPIRFNLVPTRAPSQGTAFQSTASDEFQALPAGANGTAGTKLGWTDGASGAGIQQVYYERWRMNYSVLQMAETIASTEFRWIQVNYTLAAWGSIWTSLPGGNVSLPNGSDLVPFGGVTEMGIAQGITIGELTSTRDPSIASMTFRHSLPPIVIDGGSLGNLSATLSSEFAWGSSEDYWLGWKVTPQQSEHLSVRYFIDARFGSMLVQLSAGP